jgi:hypothetical protein
METSLHNNEMKLTKPAKAGMARSSQLISVLGGPESRAQREEGHP